MSCIDIRTALPGDLAALRRVYRQASLSNEGDRADLQAHPEALVFDGTGIADGRTRVATIDGVIAGFATLTGTGSVVELEDLFTAPEWMRRGVARTLVQDAVRVAAGSGAEQIEVVANPHAMAFYLAAGFNRHGHGQTRFGPAELLRRPVGPAGRERKRDHP